MENLGFSLLIQWIFPSQQSSCSLNVSSFERSPPYQAWIRWCLWIKVQSFGVSFPSSKWWMYIWELGVSLQYWGKKVITDCGCVLPGIHWDSGSAPFLGILLEPAMKSILGATCSLFSLIWPHPTSLWHHLIPGELVVILIQFPTWTLQFLARRLLHPCRSETLSSTICYSVSQGRLPAVANNPKVLVV